MPRISRFLSFAFLTFESFLALTPAVHAGLSRPPESHVRAMPDGRHMLVFLSPVPSEVDEGRVATLPDGRQVDLRKTFPASGYYEIGSTTPIWSAPWDDNDSWTVSDDGRFLVRWNIFGDGQYKRGGQLSWGLKFYDHGTEIRNYDVAELVDYPSLMPYTTWDWHFYWIGDGDDNPAIRNNEFIFATSTHETYRFDLRTGEIVEQFHMWRMLTWIASALSAIAIVAMIVRIALRQRRTDRHPPVTNRQLPTNLPTARPGSRFSFSLRTLLLATTAIAVLCLVTPRWPHIALLAFIVSTAIFLTRAARRYRRADRSHHHRSRRITGIGLRYIVAGLAWLIVYFLSGAPVFSLIEWLRAPDDVRMAVLLTIYRPFVWIHWLWPDLLSSLDLYLKWYDRAWGA